MDSIEAALLINNVFKVDFESRTVTSTVTGLMRQAGGNETRLIELFCKNAGSVLSKQDIIQYVWESRGVYVEEGSLQQCIFNVRRLFGDDGSSIIKTVRGKGYIFTASTSEWAGNSDVCETLSPKVPNNNSQEQEHEHEQNGTMTVDRILSPPEEDDLQVEFVYPEEIEDEADLQYAIGGIDTGHGSENSIVTRLIVGLIAVCIPLASYFSGEVLSVKRDVMESFPRLMMPIREYSSCAFVDGNGSETLLSEVKLFEYGNQRLWVSNGDRSVSAPTDFQGVRCED